jgi:hypothetical protein
MPHFSTVTALVLFSFLAQPAHSASPLTQPSPTNSPRVSAVRPNNPLYDSYLGIGFSHVAANSQFATLRPHSVIIRNNTAFEVKAVVIKWTFDLGNGKIVTVFHPIFPEPQLGGLPGNLSVLHPEQTLLVSPFADVQESSSNNEQDRFISKTVTDTGWPQVANGVSVAGTIDSIIFVNGTFTGKDEFGMANKYACERNGAIDEADAIYPMTRDGDLLMQQLNNDVSIYMSQQQAPCALAKAHAAIRFASLYQKNGLPALQAKIQQILSAQKVVMKRWSPPLSQ